MRKKDRRRLTLARWRPGPPGRVMARSRAGETQTERQEQHDEQQKQEQRGGGNGAGALGCFRPRGKGSLSLSPPCPLRERISGSWILTPPSSSPLLFVCDD